MLFNAAIAIGAGLASALLFYIPVKGTMAAMVLAFAGPLPIMIAGLGFGARIGFAAACVGTLAIALALHPLLALLFAASLGLPAFWLARLAARTQPLPDHRDVAVPAYGNGQMLAWIATIAALTALIPVAALALRGPGLSINIDDVARQLAPVVRRLFNGEQNIPSGLSAREFARAIVLAMPAMFAAWTVIALSFNLWLAGRVARASGLRATLDADIPATLRLPRDCLWIFFASLAACALGETPRFIASTLTASLAAAYALHGLAAIHGFLRGNPVRPALLFGLYALIVLTAWPLVFAAAVGMFDSLIPIKRRPPAAAA